LQQSSPLLVLGVGDGLAEGLASKNPQEGTLRPLRLELHPLPLCRREGGHRLPAVEAPSELDVDELSRWDVDYIHGIVSEAPREFLMS
jgi:hypothetical protein